MNTMTLDQFRSAFQTGGFRSVGVTAAGGQFFVTAEPRSGDRVTLATTRGKTARGFRDGGKAIALLHEIGARTFEVNTSEWSPKQAAQEGRRRPDTAERQRRAHEAAAHDAWFRAEVRQALREAADPDTVWVTNDEVMRESAENEAKWLAQAAAQSR
jgi:hypothetical protein